MSWKASILALLALAVASCSPGSNKSPVGEPPSEKLEAPLTPPSIEGWVTSVDRAGERTGSIRVETRPGDTAGSPKAAVRIEQGALVLLPGVRLGDFNSLKTGQWVRVWFTGPVMESYPVQARAATVVVDSLSASGR